MFGQRRQPDSCSNYTHDCFVYPSHYWVCKTCNPDDSKRTLPITRLVKINGLVRDIGLCDECAKRCHKGHVLERRQISQGAFYCDCAQSCFKHSCHCCNDLQ